MKEKNQKTLKKALNKLPKHQPKSIDFEDVIQFVNDSSLREEFSKLPEYEAAITYKELPQKTTIKWRWIASAASLLIIGLFAFKLVINSLEKSALISTTNEDFKELVSYCQVDEWLCESNEFQSLQNAYENLDKKQKELLKSDLNKQERIAGFEELEQQKIKVLNELASLI